MRFRLIDELAALGPTFTLDQAKKVLGEEANLAGDLLYRLERRGWVERLEQGKYMIIPLGAEKGKYTLHEFLIASMLVDPYSIAYWSALHHYGMTEQPPGVVFIQTTARKKKQELQVLCFGYRVVRIVERKFFGFRKEWIEEAQINITDREKTIIDCLDLPQYAGGVTEVAKALKRGEFDWERMIGYLDRFGNTGVNRRLGYLCDYLGLNVDLPTVNTRNYLLLDPTMPGNGERNARWRLMVNLDEKSLGELE